MAYASLSDLADCLDEPDGSLRPVEVYELVRAQIRLVAKNVQTLMGNYKSATSARSIDGHVALEATLSIELLSGQLAAVEMIAAAMMMLRVTEAEDQAPLRLAVDKGPPIYDAYSQLLDSVRAATGTNLLAVYKFWKDDPQGTRAEFQQMADAVRGLWDHGRAEAKSREHFELP